MTERIKDTLAKDAERHTATQALKAMRECTDVTRMRDIVAAISNEIGIKEIAKTFAEELRDKKGKQKREFVALYLEMLARLERLEGSVTEDDASKLADDQIDAMLAEYGHHLSDNGRIGNHSTDGTGESGATERVAGAEQALA